MRNLIKFVIVCWMMSTISGCLFWKHHSKNDGSIVLQDYPMDKFKEVTNQEDKLILKDVNFDYNSSKLKPSFEKTLDGISKWISSNPDKTIHILSEGNCDERGSNEYNMALGEQRALAVRAYLVSKGIQAGRIQTVSYGEEKPLDPAHNETAWSKNRRVHFLTAND